jgi:hypothetical protein
MTWLNAAAIVILGLACTALITWIIRSELKDRRREAAERKMSRLLPAAPTPSKHDGRARGAETVPDLLKRIREASEATEWADDEDAPALVRAYIHRDYPTVVLPPVPPESPTVPLPVLVPEQPRRRTAPIQSESSGLMAYYAPRLTSDQ